MKIADIGVANLDCGYCGEPAGSPCMASGGKRATYTHSARTSVVYEAWSAGYEEANQCLLDAALDEPQWLAQRVEWHREQRNKRDATGGER